MLHFPRKSKHTKQQRGKLPNTVLSNNRIPEFGTFGLKAIDFGLLSAKQIDAVRKILQKNIKRRGKLWVRIFPQTPCTRKPIETRMGKGKGSVDFWVMKVKPGTILYEIEGVSFSFAVDLFKTVAKKLSIATRISYFY